MFLCVSQVLIMNFADDRVVSQCPKLSFPVWHQATPAHLSHRGSNKHTCLSPVAQQAQKNQCSHHHFQDENDTSKWCPSQQLYLISMPDAPYSCLINVLTEDNEGYPEILFACLWPCFLGTPIINRCFLAISHRRWSQGSRHILDFSSLMLMVFSPTYWAEETHRDWKIKRAFHRSGNVCVPHLAMVTFERKSRRKSPTHREDDFPTFL